MKEASPKETSDTPPAYKKLVIVTMGGKGGTGKTTFVTGLIEWFRYLGRPVILKDLDIENETKGGLKHFYREADKVDAHKREALNVFMDIFDHKESVMIADMGAGQGAPAAKWFTEVSAQAEEMGLGFLCVGVIANDPASVTSLLQWANVLGGKVKYLVVLNEMSEPDSDFNYWTGAAAAQQFRARYSPGVMKLASRPPELQNPLTDHGLGLSAVADEKTEIAELKRTRWVAQAKRLRKALFDDFDVHVRKHLPEDTQQRKN